MDTIITSALVADTDFGRHPHNNVNVKGHKILAVPLTQHNHRTHYTHKHPLHQQPTSTTVQTHTVADK